MSEDKFVLYKILVYFFILIFGLSNELLVFCYRVGDKLKNKVKFKWYVWWGGCIFC